MKPHDPTAARPSEARARPPRSNEPAPNPASAATISVSLDGHAYPVPCDSTLAELVAALGHAPAAVGTALNGSFVARVDRAGRRLLPGDAILLFLPIVGG